MLALLKSLKSAFLFTIVIVLVGIFGNWLFIIFWGSHIWAFDRWVGGSMGIILSVLVYLLFLVVFPLFYIMSTKLIVVTKALQTIWHTYRDEFLAVVVERAVITTLALKQRGSTVVASTQEWFADTPKLLKRLVHYVKQKVPFIETIEKALERIDWQTQHDPDIIQQQIMDRVEQSVASSDLPTNTAFLRWLIGINIMVMVGVGVLVAG